MLFSILFLIALICLVIGWSKRHRTQIETVNEFNYTNAKHELVTRTKKVDTDWWGVVAVSAALMIGVGIALAAGTGKAIDAGNDVQYSEVVLEGRKAVRDQALAYFPENLDPDDFVRISQAITPDDIKFLGSLPNVTDFMLGRADRFVEANKAYWSLYNTILVKRQYLCNITNNPLLPIVPFIDYGCDIHPADDLPGEL